MRCSRRCSKDLYARRKPREWFGFGTPRPVLSERVRCAVLLGAMLADLRPFEYQPADARYKPTLDSVLGIFNATKAASIDFKARLEAAEALGQAGDPRLSAGNWVTIEAGEFLMGTQKADPSQPNYDHQAYEDEAPVHSVWVDAFQIGRYPVTMEEFRRFIEDQGYGDRR